MAPRRQSVRQTCETSCHVRRPHFLFDLGRSPGRGVPGVHFLDLHRRRDVQVRRLRATLTLLLLLLGERGAPTARMHAHPCPAVINVRPPECHGVGDPGMVRWGSWGGVPKLPLLTWLTPINACLYALLYSALYFVRVLCVCGVTLPLPSTAGDEWQGGLRAGRCPQQMIPRPEVTVGNWARGRI